MNFSKTVVTKHLNVTNLKNYHRYHVVSIKVNLGVQNLMEKKL